MTDYLDIVPVWIKHKSTVVISIVMKSNSGLSVITPTGLHGYAVEVIYHFSATCAESNMSWWLVGSASANPEIRSTPFSETSNISVPSDRCGKLG